MAGGMDLARAPDRGPPATPISLSRCERVRLDRLKRAVYVAVQTTRRSSAAGLAHGRNHGDRDFEFRTSENVGFQPRTGRGGIIGHAHSSFDFRWMMTGTGRVV